MDAICKLGFGLEINSLSNTNSRAETSSAKAFDTTNSMLLWRYVDLASKLKRHFNIVSEVAMKESIKTVEDLVKVKPDILSRFLALSEKYLENYSDKYLRDIIFEFHDSWPGHIAVTLCWFFHFLCNNPDVEGKILQEIRDLVEENEYNVN